MFLDLIRNCNLVHAAYQSREALANSHKSMFSSREHLKRSISWNIRLKKSPENCLRISTLTSQWIWKS